MELRQTPPVHVDGAARLHRIPGHGAAPRPQVGVEALEAEARQHARDRSPDAAPPRLGRPARGASAAERALVGPALRGGERLDAGLRTRLAHRFGDPLDDVRVHTDAHAHTVARALGARAWAFGHHIGLADASGGDHPSLAHEAVHVVQQRGGPPALLRDEAGVSFDFSVRVDREMSSDELLLEFLRQYLRLSTTEEAEAARVAGDWAWWGTPQVADREAVRRKYVLIRVTERGLSPATAEERAQLREVVSGMGEAEREALYDEVDRRFWERTQYQPGERLGGGRDDRRMAESWRVIRDDMLRTRQAILALPERVRAVLFDPASPRRLSPADYEAALRVGRKLAAMSALELADWQSRTGAVTDDWAVFEASLDRYLAEEAERRLEQLELGEMATRLHGTEHLYALRNRLRGAEMLAGLPARAELLDANVTGARAGLPRLRARVAEALRERGFASMAEFEAAIVAWRRGFERETVRVADVLLDRLDHQLFVAEQRYGDPQGAADFAAAIASSGAPRHYEAASAAAERAILRPRHPMDVGGVALDRAVVAAAVESAEETRRGEAAMQALASAHPLLEFPDFPRERLGRAPADEVQGIVLDYIREHREAIRSTRAELHADSDFIYKLDNLLAASIESQGIAPGSIYDQIIRDYVSERSIRAFVTGLALAVVTLALTVLTFGTGTAAVVAGAAVVGLSSWQAVEAFREYARESRAADARLLSEDPSLAWVVVAAVGAAADLGAAMSAVRALRTAAQAFDVTGDVAAFRRAVEATPGLDARIAKAVNQAAEAEAATRQQWRAIMGIAKRPNDILALGAEGTARLMVMAWHLARRGYWRFEQFLAELQRVGLIADATGLSTAEARVLSETFQEGLRRARTGFLDPNTLSPAVRGALSPAAIDEAAAFGRFLGLDDDAVRGVLDAQAAAARVDPSELSPGALQAAMRERAGLAPEQPLVPDVRGLPEAGTRTVGAVEQAYEIGVAEGRRFLEARGWSQWERWINPFEFHGRYGQGIDDVFLDDAGRLWIVEYKGGTSELAAGQMGTDWVRRQIQRLVDARHVQAADALQAAFDAGTLRGVVVSTPHGGPAGVVKEFTYP